MSKLLAHAESIVTDAAVSDREQRFIRDIMPLREALMRRAIQLTHNTQDAEDLVQETYLHAYNKFDQFQDGTNPRAWCMRIILNAWINVVRQRRRQPLTTSYDTRRDEQLADSISGELREQEYGVSPAAEDVALLKVLDDDLRRALLDMPTEQSISVYLRDVEGWSYQRIAHFLGCPVGTVMSRLNRGRKKLRENAGRNE